MPIFLDIGAQSFFRLIKLHVVKYENLRVYCRSEILTPDDIKIDDDTCLDALSEIRRHAKSE